MIEAEDYETVPMKVRAFQYTAQTWDEIYEVLNWDKSEMKTVFEEDPQVSPDTFEVSINGGDGYDWVNRGDWVVLDEHNFIIEVLPERVFGNKYERPYNPLAPVIPVLNVQG